MKKKIKIMDQELEFAQKILPDHAVEIELFDFKYRFHLMFQDRHMLILSDGIHQFKMYKHGDEVYFKGRKLNIELVRPGRKKSSDDTGGLKSPMPGKILKIEKNVGDSVAKGDIILVMEAMKMEHSIKAPHDGTIEKLMFKAGDQVPGDTELVELKEKTNA